MFLAEAHARTLVLKASCSSGGSERGAAYDTRLIQRCFQQGTAIVGTEVREPDLGSTALMDGPRSVLCVPLRPAHRLRGVLCVERAPTHPFSDRDQLLGEAVGNTMAAGIASARQLVDRQRALFMQTMLTLAQAVDCRDPYTAGHTQRVTEYVLLLAEEVQVTAADYHHLQIGTPLHDIGKIGVEEAILRKPGRLTTAEFAQIQAHPSNGVALLQSIPELDPVLPIVGSHHEHWDGSGYPDGLIGEIISPLARLVTVADVFDALMSDRPYRKALSMGEAFDYLQRNAGTLFDPQYSQAFLRLRPRVEKMVRERGAASVVLSQSDFPDLKESVRGAVRRDCAGPRPSRDDRGMLGLLAEVGLEPTRPFGHGILSAACLPFHHSAVVFRYL